MNFDWYGASVDAPIDETAGEALRAFEMASVYPTRAMHGFNRAAELRRGDTVIARMFWENLGAPADESTYVQASGRQAAPVAAWLRQLQVGHRVSRVDVAEDFSGPGCWDALSRIGLHVADSHSIKVEHSGDFHRQLNGRSLYLGGRYSPVRGIIYEKGRQPENWGVDPDWVRAEIRVRPVSRSQKLAAAKMSPREFVGAARWSADLGHRLMQPDVAQQSMGTVYRDEDTARSRNFLLKQYGPTLTKWQEEVGGWCALGEALGQSLKR